MVTFSVLTKLGLPPTGSLKYRRWMHALRRIAVALCVGLAVVFGLEAVLSRVATTPVVVATRQIDRGTTINAEDIALVEFPVSAQSPSMLDAVEDVAGHIAAIDIMSGDPVLTHMARDAPVVPQGTTVVEVRLFSSADELVVGDRVQLVSTLGCAETAETADDENDGCVLADDALVMRISPIADTSYGEQQLVSFAMKPDAAMHIMQLEDAGAIVAVMQ